MPKSSSFGKMNDPHRVRLHQRLQHMGRDASAACFVLWAFSHQQRRQGLATQELHHDVRDAGFRNAVIEQAHGVGVLQALRERCLAAKARELLAGGQRCVRKHLHRHLATERELGGPIHLPKATGAEHGFDAVALGEDVADRQPVADRRRQRRISQFVAPAHRRGDLEGAAFEVPAPLVGSLRHRPKFC